ncbi:MAG: hypothetical protein CSA36_05405 [Draconibacterium sp.]|nr:MAG: hypothetical protein CSA36_05405 [Draconibacterium sp.]
MRVTLIYITVAFLLLPFFIVAQPKTVISGLVKDKSTGEPLIGANITFEKGLGTTTDAYGFYSLETTYSDIKLTVSYVGYKPFVKLIKLNGNLRYDILLEPGVEISEITVSARKRIEERLEAGMTELPVEQVKIMPMLGEPDVLKAMQLLPGVQGGSDGRSGLYVRGGSPDQNLFMLDGTPLYYVSHLGGFVSVFPPEVLKNIKLYKGGFPARFGGRLSSVVDLRMKEGNKKEFHGSWGIGLISGDFTLEGPIKTDKTSFIISARRMWIDLLLRPATKIGLKHASMGYNFYDFFGKISHEVDSRNRLYFSVYGGDDRLGFSYRVNEDKIRGNGKYVWGNVLSTLRWNHIYNAKINSDFTLFYTRYRYKNRLFYKSESIKGENLYATNVNDFGLKADYNWYLAKDYSLRFGGGMSGNWFRPGQISYKNELAEQNVDTIIGNLNRTKALNAYVYVENEVSPVKWWKMNIGTRLVNFNVGGKNYLSVEPRLMSNFNFGKAGAIQLGYSKIMQPVHMLTYSGATFPTDIWLPSTPGVPPGLSTQYSAGYTKSFKNGEYELRIEVYKKDMKQLIEVKGGVPLVNTQLWENNVERNGTGYSKGIELFFQKTSGPNTGWISYTLSKAERQFENIDNGRPYAFKYDRRHDFSIVYNRKIKENIDFSATWIYGSGYPTTLQNGVYNNIKPVYGGVDLSKEEYFDIGLGEAYLYPGKNWLRMRDYHRLDLGFNFRKNKTGKKGQKLERIWTVGVYNAYNRQNAVFYYYEHENGDYRKPIKLFQQSGFPVIPSVKYSVKF